MFYVLACISMSLDEIFKKPCVFMLFWFGNIFLKSTELVLWHITEFFSSMFQGQDQC